MNRTGQAGSLFPLTRNPLQPLKRRPSKNLLSGRPILKPILISAENPFPRLFFGFQHHANFGVFLPQNYGQKPISALFQHVTLHGNTIL